MQDDNCKGELFIIVVLFVLVETVLVFIGFGCGRDSGYKECLDDIRLGKTPRYKLVQTAEKWVEVEK